MNDAVGVDVERDLDLGHAHGRRGQPGQTELAQTVVVGGHGSLTLQNVDLDLRLVVLGRREDLRPLGGDGRVALDHPGHHTTLGLDSQSQGCHVE
jgi:hypothetical protein